MKLLILFLTLTFALASCNNSSDTTTRVVGKEGETIYGVTDKDKEMNAAINRANATLTEFKTALTGKNPDFKYFALKVEFKTDNGSEHIWVSDITLAGDDFFGVVDNLPESTTDVNLGDTIKIEKQDISDWMYLDKDKLIGGLTIRLLRQRMTTKEREQFDQECGFKIED